MNIAMPLKPSHLSLSDDIFQSLEKVLLRQPEPLVVANRSCPAASLWTGGMKVTQALQAAGLQPGQRVAARIPNGVAYIQAMLGTWGAGGVFCPIPLGLEDSEIERRLDAMEVATFIDGEITVDAMIGGLKLPIEEDAIRDSADARLMLWTSGSQGLSKVVSISNRNLVHQVDTHLRHLQIGKHSTVVSYLSWAHCFGGVLELLCSLFSGAVIEVPSPDRFHLESIAAALEAADHPVFFSVPKVVQQLAERSDGRILLAKIEEGIIGGAPVSGELAGILTRAGCRMRIGYGQTECTPGVMLGQPGFFASNYLGFPIGCEVRLDADDVLEVRGANVADPSVEWWNTGDVVMANPDGSYSLKGRMGRSWKWSNGRMFHPEPEEQLLSERLNTDVVVAKKSTDAAFGIARGEGTWPLRDLGASPYVTDGIYLSEEVWQMAVRPSGKLDYTLLTQLGERAMLSRMDCTLEVGAGIRLNPAHIAGDSALTLSAPARAAVERSHRFALEKAASDTPIYGWKTGFGPLVKFAADEDPRKQGFGLLCHLQAGQGPDLEPAVVRAMVRLRLHTASQGLSGISPDTVAWLEKAVEEDLIPIVPSMGSVGASGDLIPMAHAVAAYCGEGEVWLKGDRMNAEEALNRLGWEPIPLEGRDALALVNGTPLMSAAGCVALERARVRLSAASALTALLYDLLGCHDQPIRTKLHEASGHRTHVKVSDAIYHLADGVSRDGRGRPLQESYSLRCAPQVLGAALTAWEQANEVVTREINGVTDNPIFDADGDQVIHGGNFFGQEVAFAMDHLTNAMIQVANLVERQLALLMEPAQTDGLNLMLSPRPGAASGFAGVQLCATAIVAEMRRTAMPASIQTLPTNGMNQDIVPFGTHAALNTLAMIEKLDIVIGALGLAIRQAFHLAQREPESRIGKSLPALFAIDPLLEDRPLAGEVRHASQIILSNPCIHNACRFLVSETDAEYARTAA